MFRVAFCDDDINYINGIVNQLSHAFHHAGETIQIDSFSNGEDLLKRLNDTGFRINLLFLDIEMQGMSGLNVKDCLSNYDSVHRIIFLTSHSDKIYQAFGIKVIKFLVKPVPVELLKEEIVHVKKEWESRVIIKYENGKIKEQFCIEDLMYIEAQDVYTKLHFCDGKTSGLIRNSLTCWNKRLSDYPVVQIHKGIIVCFYHVSSVKNDDVIMDDGNHLKIGRNFKKEVNEKYNEFTLMVVKQRLTGE